MNTPLKEKSATALSAAPPSLLPRRTALAVFLSGITAALGAGLIWMGLLGAPHTETFQFVRGTTFADGEADRLKGFLAPAAQDSRLAIVILGHTGQDGDPDANLALSEARAEAAVSIATSLGIPSDRVSSSGLAGSAPINRANDQSDRAFQTSLARVEVTLQVRE
ncbi:MAG: OmpA family protein [Pseudomonadota bacterium]